MSMNDRRSFLSKSINSFLAIFLFNACKPSKKIATNLAIGSLADFHEGDNFMDLYRLVLKKKTKGGKVFLSAMSKLCTHQSCLLNIKEPNYICPCHGSIFSKTGQVLRGPAYQDLPHFKLSINAQSQLFVNFSDIVNPDWNLEI